MVNAQECHPPVIRNGLNSPLLQQIASQNQRLVLLVKSTVWEVKTSHAMSQNKTSCMSTSAKQSAIQINMSATEKSQQTCLDPEAYIRIIRNCNNQEPKYKSSYYPKQQKKKKK